MTDKVTRILLQIARLTTEELNELRDRLNDDPPGGTGVREPRRPRTPGPPPLQADAEDRSIKGRTL